MINILDGCVNNVLTNTNLIIPHLLLIKKTQLFTDYTEQSAFQTNFDEILGKFPKNWGEVAFEFKKSVKKIVLNDYESNIITVYKLKNK
jgi:hypothetical protein